MITLEKIKNLIQDGESEILEFKKTTGMLQAVFETVCAFLNGHGGTVLIGVNDNGKVVGQDVTDKTRQEIANHISKLEPAAQAHLQINYVPVEEGKRVIIISVTSGGHSPYVYDGRPFFRNQSTTSRMTQHRYEQLIVKRGQLNHTWDEQPAVGYKVSDLDHKEVRRTIESGIKEHRIAAEIRNYSVEKMLRYLELLDGGQVTNAAVVLYAKKIKAPYSHCLVRMTRYRGNNKLANFIDSKHFGGNAFQILTEADFFAMRHLPVASFFEPNRAQRIDKPALPVMALREALINAICHRNYAERAASISFSIFNDRLEIWNNGELLPPLQLKDLKYPHESFPRNAKIAEVFRASGWVEKAGVGTIRMIEECKALGVPAPKFELYSGGFAVVFKFVEPIGIEVKGSKVLSDIKLTIRQKGMLEIIQKHKTINIKQIKLEMKNSLAQRTIQKELNNLKNMGVINYKGKGRAVEWFIL